MKFASMVLLILIAGAIVSAVRMMIRRRKAGKYNSCVGCTGCSDCRFSCGVNRMKSPQECHKDEGMKKESA